MLLFVDRVLCVGTGGLSRDLDGLERVTAGQMLDALSMATLMRRSLEAQLGGLGEPGWSGEAVLAQRYGC